MAGNGPIGTTRAKLVRALADGVAESFASGDVEAARIAVAALRALVGEGDDGS